MKRVIEGATHVDLDGNSWIIPQLGHEDGTGLLWVDDLGWCSSEIGDTLIATLTPALLGAMADKKVDFRSILDSIEIEPKKPRGGAAKGRFGGSKQTDLPME